MLAYETRGEGGQTAFLLHGFLGSSRNLGSLGRRLAAMNPALRLVLPDLTGHGKSPPLPDGADVTTLAQDVLGLAASLQVPKPVALVGHSLGGRVALAARLLAPEAVGQVVLLDISPAPLVGITDGLLPVLDRLLQAPAEAASRQIMRDFFLTGGVTPALADWLLMNLVSEGGVLRWRIDRQALGAMHRRSAGASLWPAVETPGMVTTCIRGGLSRFVSDADVDRLQRAGCGVHTLAQAGHYVHTDDPAGLLAALGQVFDLTRHDVEKLKQ